MGGESSAERVALVTGGTRGIGLGIARALASEGWSLALCGRRGADEVRAVVDDLTGSSGEASYVTADISLREDRSRLVETTRRRFGRLDLLVNNAGVAPRVRADLLEATEESFERVLGINLEGPYFLTQRVARLMLEQKRQSPSFTGCIVNVSSISATVASVNRGEYCVSKAGLAMATQLWATRLAEHGICVYEVRPGVVATDMTAGVKERYDRLLADGLAPQRRWGLPEDVGKAVAALARGDFPYSTGAVIMVDGGLTIPRL